ncbi:MAG: hypothetical protein GTO41_13000, partial [Burkholderiales bacterium]|nr:hypothetical protein [Burkholderiales bacterium]
MRRFTFARLAVWAGLLAVSAVIIARSSLSTDLQAFLPAEPTPAQRMLADQLRDSLVSRLILVVIDGNEPSVLAELSRQITERLVDDPMFVKVDNGSEEQLQASRAFLFEHRYLLSPAINEGHFSEQNLRGELRAQLQMLASSMGTIAGSLISADPTGEFFAIIERFESEQRPDTRHGVWFDAAGARALLVAQTSAPGFDIDAQETAVGRIVGAFEDGRVVAGNVEAELTTVGPGVLAGQIRDAIRADAIRVTTAAGLAIAALLLFVMRSARAL